MDDLNNKQIVLLTMFTSFVISIATGIITVAMLEEAPQRLTQTVNRVVERTIERVVTGTSTSEKSPTNITNITKEVTVYAKEDDLAVAAVEKNQPRIAKIYAAGSSTSSTPLAIGFVASRDGVVVTESTRLFDEVVGVRERYTVIIGDRSYSAFPMPNQLEVKRPVYFLKIPDLPKEEALDAVTLGRSGDIKLAQTVVVLGGSDGSGVFKTTLSRFQYLQGEGTSTPAVLSGVETIPKIMEGNLGSLVVNLDGQAMGIVVNGDETVKYVIYPIARLIEFLGNL